ncbi:MAG: hypothetical protein AAGI90_03740 [Chlamydiota bacterium]
MKDKKGESCSTIDPRSFYAQRKVSYPNRIFLTNFFYKAAFVGLPQNALFSHSHVSQRSLYVAEGDMDLPPKFL